MIDSVKSQTFPGSLHLHVDLKSPIRTKYEEEIVQSLNGATSWGSNLYCVHGRLFWLMFYRFNIIIHVVLLAAGTQTSPAPSWESSVRFWTLSAKETMQIWWTRSWASSPRPKAAGRWDARFICFSNISSVDVKCVWREGWVLLLSSSFHFSWCFSFCPALPLAWWDLVTSFSFWWTFISSRLCAVFHLQKSSPPKLEAKDLGSVLIEV